MTIIESHSSADGSAGSNAAWASVHTRSAALREVVRLLDDGQALPWDAATTAVFRDRDDLLQALHELWSRRLDGRIDLALETDDHELTESVARAWIETVDDLPGVRRVLDDHADEPALRQLERTQHRAVAVAAGLATFEDPIAHSATVGAEFVASVRGRTPDWRKKPSLLRRLLRALTG
jgi:glycine/D-amino acid oxidase-like deaminating enzyme